MTVAGQASVHPDDKGAVPTEPGTASLGLPDFDALQAGTVTRAELASRCGVSRQAIAKWLKKIRNGEGSTQRSNPGGKSGPVLNAMPIDFSGTDAQNLAVSVAFGAVVAIEKSLREATLGPSAIKASVTALGDAVAILERFQVESPPEETERLPELSISRMTQSDEAVIRATNDEAGA